MNKQRMFTCGKKIGWTILIVAAALLAGCSHKKAVLDSENGLEAIAFSDSHWTGLALSRDGRLFVNYPRWSENVPVSVAEIIAGKAIPYPNASINTWKSGLDPEKYLVCVQAVFIDSKNRLWILDPANPQFKGVVSGGPKLIQVDLKTNSIVRTYLFDNTIAPSSSYLNDVRIDIKNGFAYITDSGAGALISLNLETGKAHRFLADDLSTSSEHIILTIGGRPWMFGENRPEVNADGIAYDSQNDILYYQALTGRTMYSLPASVLRNFSLTDKEVAARIKVVGKTGAADGLFFGPDGKIYISGLEENAILRTTPDGKVETVIQDKKISWPDSFSIGPDGKLYFTTSRIHEGDKPKAKYGIYRINIEN